jgi:hypothetical protein
VEIPKTYEALGAVQEAVRIYDALSAKEKKVLKNHGIDASETLTLLYFVVSEEWKNASHQERVESRDI